MELKSLVSYKSAFELTKIIVIVMIVVFGSILLFGFIYMQNQITDLQEKVIIIDTRGQLYPSGTAHREDMRIYEYQNHVKTFYNLWYGFDENSYKNNIEAGLYLLGECGIEMLNFYEQENVERMLYEKNMRFEVRVQDIQINMQTIPISGKIEGEQTIKRNQGKITRLLNFTFTLHDVDRSEKNPHGVKIENWEIKEQEIIQ